MNTSFFKKRWRWKKEKKGKLCHHRKQEVKRGRNKLPTYERFFPEGDNPKQGFTAQHKVFVNQHFVFGTNNTCQGETEGFIQ